jgi:hypothetical protein
MEIVPAVMKEGREGGREEGRKEEYTATMAGHNIGMGSDI